jgi:hypothetical protein
VLLVVQGEAVVKSVYPNATIIRPGKFFGPEDRLLNWCATPLAPMPHTAIQSTHRYLKPCYIVIRARGLTPQLVRHAACPSPHTAIQSTHRFPTLTPLSEPSPHYLTSRTVTLTQAPLWR